MLLIRSPVRKFCRSSLRTVSSWCVLQLTVGFAWLSVDVLGPDPLRSACDTLVNARKSCGGNRTTIHIPWQVVDASVAARAVCTCTLTSVDDRIWPTSFIECRLRWPTDERANDSSGGYITFSAVDGSSRFQPRLNRQRPAHTYLQSFPPSGPSPAPREDTQAQKGMYIAFSNSLYLTFHSSSLVRPCLTASLGGSTMTLCYSSSPSLLSVLPPL